MQTEIKQDLQTETMQQELEQEREESLPMQEQVMKKGPMDAQRAGTGEGKGKDKELEKR